ncbi:MAG: hypothetical protein R3C05_29825 [Pirellulaceae bacterium]
MSRGLRYSFNPPQSTSGLQGAYHSTTFDIDADPAAVSTNGQFLMVGVGVRIACVQPIPTTCGDDIGTVLIYKINSDQTVSYYQTISSSTNLNFANKKFGSNIVMDGDTAAIPFVDASGNWVQIWRYNPSTSTARRSDFSGGSRVDLDRDTLITSTGLFGTGVQIYQRNGSTWSDKASFALTPVGVTIDGNTASVVAAYGIHILQQNATGQWIDTQTISSPVESCPF